MISAAKILGVGLLAAVVVGCGGAAENNPVNQGTDCDLPSTAQCPGGFKQIKGAQATGEADVSGGKLVGSGDCSFVCCPDGTRIEGDSCADKSTEGSEGSDEGPEGTPPEGIEGTEGIEGVEGDAGTEGPEGGECTPDCIGKTCGDDGCDGECGSCDKLPPPDCKSEKQARTYQKPSKCTVSGQCQFEEVYEDCEGFNTCGAVEPGKCGCKALTVQTACLDKQKDCGTIDNKCGGTVNCGTCTAPNTCGGGGTENVCGCPVCTAPETCGGGGKPGACGAPAGTVYWAKRFGGADGDFPYSIAVDSQGNTLVTGTFRSSVDFGGDALECAGNDDIFLAKYDPSGAHLWSQRFGAAGADYGRSVAVDDQGAVLVTGLFSDSVDLGGGVLTSAGGVDIFLAKYDADGTPLWSKRFGDIGEDQALALTVDSKGACIVTGYSSGIADFGGGAIPGSGNHDMFVAKYDSGGNHVWSRYLGGPGLDEGLSVAVDGSGNVVVTGVFSDTIDFGGGPLNSAGGLDIFVAKYDGSGNHVWSKRFGDIHPDRGSSVALDAQGNTSITGYFQRSADFGGGLLTTAEEAEIFVAKYDGSGNHVWSKRLGDTGSDTGRAVSMDAQGNVVVSGYFQGTADFGGGGLTSAGGSDIFVAKYDASGNHVWSQRFGGIGVDEGSSIAVHTQGHVLITGYFSGPVDFGGILLTSAGGYDIFLLKLAK